MGMLGEPYQFSEKVWLRSDRFFGGVHVCFTSESGELGNIAFLRMDSNRVFSYNDTPIGKIDDPSFRACIEKITGTGDSNLTPRDVNDTVVFRDVCTSYEETGSIKKTAKEFGMSEEKTRKILITEGVYTCKQYEDIKKLLDDGKSISDISEQLKMTSKQVRAYLPYG